MRFYKCEHCGNMIYMVRDSNVNPVCCGENMKEIIAGTVEASKEKHIPEVNVKDNVVEVVVGAVIHPMLEAHYIEWIGLETEKGVQFKYLKPNQESKATFVLKDDKPVVAYEYCNLHGLWKKEI